ncbi:MAG: metallophosphoesterase [Bacteroidaceae bacterium]|nr:metallophosphoesterase [Bacteroidaceae bacterium]
MKRVPYPLHPRFLLAILFICIGVTSCDLIEYHPYDGRLDGARHLTQENIRKIEALCADKDTIRFAEISDTQRWYDDTEDLIKAINQRGDIDFVIHCGDHTDFGLTKEFLWMRNIYQKLSMPYVCLIGNHDCLGTGEDVYQQLYGDVNFSFDAGFVHFLCLNTNAFEYDYSIAVPDFEYIKTDLHNLCPNAVQTVVAMHAKPGSEQFNNNVLDYFEYSLNQFPNLKFCICGHNHHTTIEYPFEGGVPYYQCACAKERTYLVFTITRDTYTYEAVKI